MFDESALYPSIRRYLASLEGQQPPFNEVHQASIKQLSEWLKKQAKLKSDIIVICTGNSRRSLLASTLGNIIAASRDWHGVRFFSAGTSPSAFNLRTIATLKQIGLEITATGSQAKSGAKGEMNPHYRVQWGKGQNSFSLEYSKALGDVSLPSKDFGAILVCSEADRECPTVEGASMRLGLPFADPKEHDGKPNEAAGYAQTRDLIAKTLLRLQRD